MCLIGTKSALRVLSARSSYISTHSSASIHLHVICKFYQAHARAIFQPLSAFRQPKSILIRWDSSVTAYKISYL